MMKLFLIYLFCVSITLQSFMGPFVCFNFSMNALDMSMSIQPQNKLLPVKDYTAANNLKKGHYTRSEITTDNHISTDVELPKFYRDSVVEHLFSPSNCPEAGFTFLFIAYHILGHCFDLLSIEEKINNHVHSYSSYFRNIEIGLPITKIIFPYHNFY